MPSRVEFFFDFSSAYSYFAAYEIDSLLAPYDCSVLWQPISLGAIFKANSHQPDPLDSPKGCYIKHDVERCAENYGLPFRWPTTFPFNSIPAARFYYAIALSNPKQAVAYAKGAFHSAMGKGQDLSDLEVLSTVATAQGLDARLLLEAIERKDIKQQLRDATTKAQQAKIFGTPSFLLNGELFWGADRLSAVAKRVAEQHG